jgi:hypothetical protein
MQMVAVAQPSMPCTNSRLAVQGLLGAHMATWHLTSFRMTAFVSYRTLLSRHLGGSICRGYEA